MAKLFTSSKEIVFLKLGGSLITNKSRAYTAEYKVINEMARQIKKALSINPNLLLFIGNGAGSFAHYPAQLYSIKDGIKTKSQEFGFCLVQDAAARLNRIIIEALLKVKVKAFSLQPSAMITTENGSIKKFFIEPFIELIQKKVVPVFYGDIVNDTKRGSSILSTEQLIVALTLRLIKKGFKVKRIIHNGITRGVLDEKGNLISKISLSNIRKLKNIFTKTAGFDVTGGMFHKVQASLSLVKLGIKTIIINGLSEKDLLTRALLGDSVSGTVIE